MANYQNIDPARLDAECSCVDPTDAACCAPFFTAPDGTPISTTPGAVLPITMVYSQRVGALSWVVPPAPENPV